MECKYSDSSYSYSYSVKAYDSAYDSDFWFSLGHKHFPTTSQTTKKQPLSIMFVY